MELKTARLLSYMMERLLYVGYDKRNKLFKQFARESKFFQDCLRDIDFPLTILLKRAIEKYNEVIEAESDSNKRMLYTVEKKMLEEGLELFQELQRIIREKNNQ